MAQTFDTSRVGGGTYELEQDSSGNYTLKSVGFAQVNKLNLPNLTNLDIPQATIGPITKQPVKTPGVADPFKKLYSQQDDNNKDLQISQNYERINPKDISVKQAGDRQALDPRDDRSPQEIQNLKDAQGTYNQMQSYINEAKGDIGIGVSQGIYDLKDKANETIMSAKEKYATETQYNTPKTTGLQAVKSNFQKAKEKANQIIDGSLTIKLFKGIGKGLKTFEDALLGPQQVALNKSNKDALTSLGYKTRGELGSNVDSQRIAGNPATNVFAGMNRTSATGNVMAGARKRVSTIQRTIDRAKAKGDTAKAERFEARKKEFNKQIEEVQAKKNKADLATGGVAPGASGGGGGSGGCFLKGTLITMLDGTTKTVEQVDLGDKVAVGGKVFAVGRFLNTELYDYKGIKVSGSHMVNEDGVWVRVRDTKHGKSLGDDLNTVYVFGSENRRILINNILFTDYFEVSEQDQLINNEKDFFNNWKSYENTIDEHNVNTLNAS